MLGQLEVEVASVSSESSMTTVAVVILMASRVCVRIQRLSHNFVGGLLLAPAQRLQSNDSGQHQSHQTGHQSFTSEHGKTSQSQSSHHACSCEFRSVERVFRLVENESEESLIESACYLSSSCQRPRVPPDLPSCRSFPYGPGTRSQHSPKTRRRTASASECATASSCSTWPAGIRQGAGQDRWGSSGRFLE